MSEALQNMSEETIQQAPAAERPALAHIHGEPMLEMPKDLYIPPDALELVLATFQGPLDLLLYLIRKHNLDVLDIPMAQLTRQYMDYIELMQQGRLELAAEYLLMAAVLIEIKSRMLLPRQLKPAEDDDEDPRVELMRRLLEYEQMKLAALKLNELPQAGRDFELVQVIIENTVIERLPNICVDDLRMAWLALLTRAKLHTHHKVRHGEFEAFENLFDVSGGIPQLVVTFIAILELAKETLVEITQTESLGKIYVRTSNAHNAE
jgi:segregation and condensation protein A